MKRTYILYFVILIIGCHYPDINGQQNADFILNKTTELTDLHKEAYAELRQEAIDFNFNMLIDSIFLYENEYTFKAIPHYEIDEDKFMEDPRDERIIECLRISEVVVSFLVEANTGELYHLKADKVHDPEMWSPTLSNEDLRSKLSWLATEIKKTDTGDYVFFMFKGRSFYILQFDGKPVFYDILGRKWEEGRVSGFFASFLEIDKIERANPPDAGFYVW